MKELRIQIRVGLLIVAFFTVIFWTVPQITKFKPDPPIMLLWIEHNKAEQWHELMRAPDGDLDLATQQAFKCKPDVFSIYLSPNGLQSVYWAAVDVDEALLKCLSDDSGQGLTVSWDEQDRGFVFPPHYRLVTIH